MGCATSVAQIAARGLKPREIALVLLKKWPLDKTENAHRSERSILNICCFLTFCIETVQITIQISLKVSKTHFKSLLFVFLFGVVREVERLRELTFS